MSEDSFRYIPAGIEAPGSYAAAVTPDNSTDLTTVTRGLYVGASGDVKVTMAEDDVVTFPGMAGGLIHPLRVKRVWATGTTATGIVAVY